jgi:NAD(P)-dependent dehydrogenase (short-subunit alcohol dehydrogenase family)
VALVTGAGRGLGRAEALYLAASGFSVIVNDWDADGLHGQQHDSPADGVVNEILAAGGVAAPDYSDVASTAGAESLAANAVKNFGRIDVLVNNAGILRSEPFIEMPISTFDEVLRVCLMSHIEASRAVAKWWAETGEAGEALSCRRIINTTSLAGAYGAASGTTAYATAKAGVIGMTLSLSRELSGLNATVNAIAPRAATRMTSKKREFLVPEFRDRFAPDRVAPFVGWLAGERSGQFTGRVFVVGGGKVWLVRPFETFGPYLLAESPDTDTLPVLSKTWEINQTAVPTWPEIELRFA